MRILLADDQNEIRMLTAHQLRGAGHSVVEVANGEAALAEFLESPFDIILLDEQMPVLSGVAVLHAIRADTSTPRQVVIALTGYNTEPDRLRLLNEGFDFVIGKPFRLDQLEATLLSVFDFHVRPKPPSADSSPSVPKTLLQTVGGDERLLRRMSRVFLRDSSKRMAQIAASIRRNRPDNLASAAHALKGSVAIFGASEAQRCCQQLQEAGRSRELSNAGKILAQLKEEIAKLEANLRGYAGQTSPSASGASPNLERHDSVAKRKPR